ncbi:MAG: hypothetical protein ACLSB9_22265 [Hydrogeniiclostridium mannosilyticum]
MQAIIQQYDYEKNDYEFKFVCLNCIQDLMNMKECGQTCKNIFADMEETDSVFKTKQPVLIIEWRTKSDW